MAEDTGRRPQNYVRPDELTPAGPNPFDNGTAEPAPALGDPNGRSLEDVTSIAPPSVYEKETRTPNGVTAKAPLEERAKHDAAVLAADDAEDQRLRDAANLWAPPITPADAEPEPKHHGGRRSSKDSE